MTLKQTPLSAFHRALNAKMAEYASYEMPIVYTSIIEEHLTVRRDAGLFDVSHMGEILIEGKDSGRFIQSLFTNRILDVPNGKVVYGFFCNESGGVVDDLLVYKYHDEKYLLVVNAANRKKDLDHIFKYHQDEDVMIQDISDVVGLVALQGPKAERILQKLTTTDLTNLKPFTFIEPVTIAGIEAMISRTGYTGEDGFEVYTNAEELSTVWHHLLEVGKDYGLKPIGLGARDTLRFEAGFPLYGNELSETITPLEAGLHRFVKFEHDFIGKEALLKQQQEGVKRTLVGLKLLDRGIVRSGYEVLNEQHEPIGTVTTGYMIPGHQIAVACALIKSEEAMRHQTVLVALNRRIVKAEITSPRFLVK